MTVLKIFLSLLLIGIVVAEPRWYNSTDGRQYLVENELKYNWLKAYHECSRHNLQLVEIQTEEKNTALVKLLREVFGEPVGMWLGANDEFNPKIDTSRPFHWSSTGDDLTYTYWHKGEPNNERGVEHCVHIFASDPDFRWNDVSCDYEYGYICEEPHTYAEYRESMKERRQRVLNTLKKFFEIYKKEEKETIEKVHVARELLVKKSNAIQTFVEDIHKKMSRDFNHGAKLHSREVNNFASDTNQMIRDIKENVQEATLKSYNKIAAQGNKVQENVENILEEIDI